MTTEPRRSPVQTDQAPAAIGPYSQAIAAGGFLFVSGQIALDPSSGEMVGDGDITAETRQVLANLGAVLAAGGCGFGDVVKATIYLSDMADFATVNGLYGDAVGTETPPARAAFAVAQLPKNARVEIEAVALLPDRS